METISIPFSRAYWKRAASLLRQTRMLAIAALVIAMRVAVRSLTLPITESLYISLEFLPTAVGGMIYGPIMGLFVGAVSDVLGALLFPKGPFFPPFMLVNMLQGFLFGFFLYGAPVSLLRALYAKLSVNVLCNILLTPLMLSLMGGQAAYIASVPRIIKNIVLLPVEIALLLIVLRAVQPAIRRLRV